MDLHAHSGRNLQNFMALLNQFESAGVTDIRFVRAGIQRHVDTKMVPARLQRVKGRIARRIAKAANPPEQCPSCGNMSLFYKPRSLEGFPVMFCECGFSQPTEVR